MRRVVLGVLALGLAGCAGESGTTTVKDAPGFVLSDVNGKSVDFAATNGRVRLVDFWATWCPPCRDEMPAFKSLYGKYHARGFDIIGVSMDQDGPAVVRKFAAENRIPWTNVMADQYVPQRWDIGQGIPSTFLVNRKGQIIEHWVGAPRTKELDDAVAAAL